MAKRKRKSSAGNGLKKYRNFLKKKTKSEERQIKKLETRLNQVKRKKAAKEKKAARLYRKKYSC